MNSLVWTEQPGAIYVRTEALAPDLLPLGGELLAYALRVRVEDGAQFWRVVSTTGRRGPDIRVRGCTAARQTLRHIVTGGGAR